MIPRKLALSNILDNILELFGQRIKKYVAGFWKVKRESTELLRTFFAENLVSSGIL
jgi:hypothetical protein